MGSYTGIYVAHFLRPVRIAAACVRAKTSLAARRAGGSLLEWRWSGQAETSKGQEVGGGDESHGVRE